jgi:serine protease Do
MLAVDGFSGKRRGRFLPYIFGGITGVSLGLLIVVAVLYLRGSDSPPRLAVAGPAQTVYRDASLDEARRSAIVRATEQVAPAVVSIKTTFTRRTRPVYDSFWNRYYPGRVQTFTSQGSGVIIDSKGYIFTNFHVIDQAERITVTTFNGERYEAELVYPAESYDLALIKIPGDHFPVAPLGDSDALMVGEWSIAIGSPYGSYLVDTQPTVTVGVISANHRDIKQRQDSEQVFNDMIQTDAAINPGNSGGPLVNSAGEVIGINTVIFSGGTGANIGMGFAIPVNRAWHVYSEVVKYGRVRQVTLGMKVSNVTPELAIGLGLPADSGVLVRTVEEGGPADKAGLRPGDQLLAINGIRIQSYEHANRIIFGSAVGDVLEITVNRKDEIKTFKVKLEERRSGT